MYIESVQLKNFRNYDSLEVNFDQGTNIFYGDNAQGKTNILESLYLCGTTKSHKGSKDKEVIRFGEEDAHIRMMVKRNELSAACLIRNIICGKHKTVYSILKLLLTYNLCLFSIF